MTLTTPLSGRFFIGRVGLAVVSQCTKFAVSRLTRYEAINGGAKCRKWGGLGRLGGTQCHHSIERIRLPIRHAPILYRFRDIASYLSKVADFDPPHLHLAPPQRVIPVEFRGDLWRQKIIGVSGLSCGVFA